MKLYQDPGFLESDDARSLRILAEYIAPLAAFRKQRIHDTIVFFGSARQGEDGPFAAYYKDARELARLVTEWSRSVSDGGERFLVCTGGGGGIMEAANRGAADAGGRSIGLNIGLPHEQKPNAFISEGLGFEFHYFFMRKLWFAHLARAIVIFPGGYGTLDELFEILTLIQTGKLDRDIFILLYGGKYWREIIDFEALARHGMISAKDSALLRFADDPRTALEMLQAALPLTCDLDMPAFAKSIGA
jgi:uncharacterized protein (TIGR00730 family)